MDLHVPGTELRRSFSMACLPGEELGRQESARKVRFFYGARTSADLFNRELIEELGSRLSDFEYAEVLSEPDSSGWTGATGWARSRRADAR